MNQFPPPTSPPVPGDEPTESNPTDAPSSSRRRLALAAVAATALGVAGVAVGSQLAAADDAPTDEPTSDRPDEESTGDTDDGDADNTEDDDVGNDDDGEDETESPRGDDATPDDRLPDVDEWFDLDELNTAFDEFHACLSDNLPDLRDGGWIDVEIDGEELPNLDDLGDFDFGDFDFGDFDDDWGTVLGDLVGGSVTVFSPGSADDLTFLDFGDGDGTITITQTDGEIEISTDGDVSTVDADLPFDMTDIDGSELPDIDIEPDPEFDAAFEECSALLPDGGIFDMVGEVMNVFDDLQD